MMKYPDVMIFHLTRRFLRMNSGLKVILLRKLHCEVRNKEEEPRRGRIKERGCRPK